MRSGTMNPNLMTEAHATHGRLEMAGVGHYGRFAVMIALSFIAMYVLMYSMVDAFSSVYNNVNQVYMAGLMAAPMAIIELVMMRSMYTNKKVNAAIIAVSIGALLFFWFGIRNQVGVGDKQFARSMIPHHSGAILMCNEAKISDPELKTLCSNIIASQRSEIDQLKSVLGRLE